MNEPALQRYQVMEPLGRGSQAELYRGVDRETGRSVAIKILSLDKVEGWKGFELFEREIKTLMRLEHPRTPRYLDNYAVSYTHLTLPTNREV